MTYNFTYIVAILRTKGSSYGTCTSNQSSSDSFQGPQGNDRFVCQDRAKALHRQTFIRSIDNDRRGRGTPW
jgi:hypothetical protein